MNNPIKFTNCISCRSKKIKKIKGIYLLHIKGKEVKVPDIEYYSCPDCGERFTDLDNDCKIDSYFKKKIRKSVA